MKLKTYLSVFLLILGLVSCNTNRGVGSPPAEDSAYDDPTSPLQGVRTYSASLGTFSFALSTNPTTALFVVSEKGIFVKNINNPSQAIWQKEPLALPAGLENSKILDADVVNYNVGSSGTPKDTYTFIATRQSQTGNLGLLYLSNDGVLTEVTGLPSLPAGDARFIKEYGNLETSPLLLARKADGSPALYAVKANLSEVEEITPQTPLAQLTAQDEVIGYFSGSGHFLVKIANDPKPYQLWTLNLNYPIYLEDELQNKDLVLATFDHSTGFSRNMVVARNGQSWQLGDGSQTSLGKIWLEISQAFVSDINPTVLGALNSGAGDFGILSRTNVLNADHSYFEIQTKKLTVPEKTTNKASFDAKGIQSLTITGFFKFDRDGTYITTSDGLWFLEEYTSGKWRGI